MLEEELQAVRPVDIVDEDDTFAFDELQLEDNIDEQELVDFRAPIAKNSALHWKLV